VCPSHIPLVQYYRFAKAEIWAQERDKEKAELARKRHEFRQQRLEREKAERASRLHKKKAELKVPQTPEDESAGETTEDKSEKKAAILAALERARAKREGEAKEENE